jgi:hypothetical protein
MYVYIDTYICTFIYIYLCTSIYSYIYIYICVCVCVCIHIIYIHTFCISPQQVLPPDKLTGELNVDVVRSVLDVGAFKRAYGEVLFGRTRYAKLAQPDQS